MSAAFTPADPDWRQRVETLFDVAPFIRALGVTLVDLAPGQITTELVLRPDHAQQNGFVHAGVQATLADHSMGAAAATLMSGDRMVLTIEFKISLMSPARGDKLICRAGVLKPGRSVSFVEAKVFAVTAGTEKLVSHATASMALAAG